MAKKKIYRQIYESNLKCVNLHCSDPMQYVSICYQRRQGESDTEIDY